MTSFLSGIHKMYTSSSSTHNKHDDTANSNMPFATSIFMDGMTISLSIFSISAICFVKYVTQQQHRRSPMDNVPFFHRRRKSLHDLSILHNNEEMNHNESLSHYDGNSNTSQNNKSSMMMMISNRGKTALLPVIPYQKQFFTALGVRIYYSFLNLILLKIKIRILTF
jgi:hypothetical protein